MVNIAEAGEIVGDVVHIGGSRAIIAEQRTISAWRMLAGVFDRD